MRKRDLDTVLASLDRMDGPELKARWERLTGLVAPRLRPRLMRLALAWEMQASVHGGLPRRVTQRLEQLAGAKTRTTQLRPGMRLVREWKGVLHQVHVEEDGAILWNDATWKSLSEVARAITGTRWSGPAFFGLKTATAAQRADSKADRRVAGQNERSLPAEVLARSDSGKAAA